MTPAQLADAAKCYCYDNDTWKRIVAYLLSTRSGGGVCPQDMQVAWTPTNLQLGQDVFLGFYGDFSGFTSLTFNQTQWRGIDLIPDAAPNVTSIQFQNLVTSTNSLTITGFTAITTLSFPLLQTSLFGISIQNNTALTSVDLPSLTAGDGGVVMDGQPLLTSVNMPVLIPKNGINYRLLNAALDATSINQLLRRAVLNAAYVSGIIATNGGTSSAPTGQGIADKATLIGRGVTVTTN